MGSLQRPGIGAPPTSGGVMPPLPPHGAYDRDREREREVRDRELRERDLRERDLREREVREVRERERGLERGIESTLR